MDTPKKLTFIHVLMVGCIVAVSLIFSSFVSKIERSYSDFTDQTLLVVSALHEVRFSGLRIVSSTSEAALHLVVDRQEPPASHEHEDNLIEAGKNNLIKGLREYSVLVKKFFPDEMENLDKITIGADRLMKGSARLLRTAKESTNGDEIAEEKERFESDEKVFLTAVVAALKNEAEEIHESQENIQTHFLQTNKTIWTGLAGISFIILLAGWFLSRNIVKPLQRLQIAAETANEAKSEFLSSMSHELRTPMNSILGFAQMLNFNPREPLSEDQQNATDHILRSGQHLLKLIEDILDFSKVDAGKMEFSLEDLSTAIVVNDALEMVKSLASTREIEVRPPKGSNFTVKGDHTRLTQCVVNLLTNAIKYNRSNGTVIVDVRDIGHGNVRMSISDTGKGIPTEKQNQLFQPFSRLGFENSEIEGSGIGLSLTKQLIENMGGTIGFKSEEGIGSTFWIELAGKAVGEVNLQPTTSEKPQILSNSSSQKFVLYIEDNPENLSLMEMIVSRIDNVELISAFNAEIGIELARAERPDLILIDINLPGMNGIEALKKLMQMDETARIPTIAVSAAASKRNIERALNAGFKAYLTKPINIAELQSVFKSHLDLE